MRQTGFIDAALRNRRLAGDPGTLAAGGLAGAL
jgi:hypothetical protein